MPDLDYQAVITRKSRAVALAEGGRRYFTGKPCRRGHLSERAADSGTCIACARERYLSNADERRAANRRRWAANSERYNATGKRWKAQNKDKAEAAKKRWADAHPDSVSATQKRWKAKNPEKQADYARRARAAFPDRTRDTKRRWEAKNPEAVRARTRNRQARKRMAPGYHTASDIAALLVAQAHVCVYCKVDLRTVTRHVDHIMPLARGGGNDPSNLQILCASCNCRKWAHDPVEFAARMGAAV